MRRSLVAFLGVAAMLLVFVPPVAACAPPPPGWVRVYPIEEYLTQFGPTVLALVVPGFFVLRSRRPLLRLLGVGACIGFAAIVLTFTVLLGMNCGHYAPPS